jgi:hypothetical protein
MTAQIETITGYYVYAFMRADDREAVLAEELVGIEDASISVVVKGDLAAVLSPIRATKIRPQRKSLAAHQEIVTVLSRKWSMLPVSFGLVADDLDQIDRILENNSTVLNQQIDRVDGQVEMTVVLKWTAENIVQYFVDRYPELAAARELIVSGKATRDDQIELGRSFERLLNTEREQHTQEFLDALRPLSREIDVQTPREQCDVMRISCLIDRNSEAAFNAAVYQVAEKFSDEFAINFNGPWPPYSFVKLALSME